MTKKYRCIICELVWDETDLADKQICNICDRSVANNNERRRHWSIFSHYAQEVFYIRYPEPNHSWVTIPSDDEGKAKIIEKAKRNLAIGINSETANKEHMEKNNNTSGQVYKDTVANIAQMEKMAPLIVNLENRYCKK